MRRLREDLPELRHLLDQLQAAFHEDDVRAELNANLRQYVDEFERIAKRTRNNIREQWFVRARERSTNHTSAH